MINKKFLEEAKQLEAKWKTCLNMPMPPLPESGVLLESQRLTNKIPLITEEKIKEIVFTILNDNYRLLDSEMELTLETDLVDDMMLDSLESVELAMELEEEFDKYTPPGTVTFPDGDYEHIKTINDLVNYIKVQA